MPTMFLVLAIGSYVFIKTGRDDLLPDTYITDVEWRDNIRKYVISV